MVDLIDKYFREDLTEAEEQLLSDQLLGSDEASSHFASLAEQKYRSYGLPEPTLGGAAGGFLRDHGRLLALLLGAIGIFGAAIFVVLSCLRSSTSCEVVPLQTTQPEAVLSEKVPLTTQPVIRTARQAVQRALMAVPSPVVPSETPDRGKGLQIVFKMLAPGHASVRVFAPGGSEVRRLFDGEMTAGSWTVDWDGLLADGNPALPGLYRVEVETNGKVKSREVRIR
jgi:hypothetical protein